MKTSDYTIYDFSKAVKNEFPNLLIHVDSGQLDVYPPGTAVPVPDGTDPCDPESTVVSNLKEENGKRFIVVAPSQQMNAEGE